MSLIWNLCSDISALYQYNIRTVWVIIMNKNVVKFSISKNISNEPFCPISRPFTKQLGEFDEARRIQSILARCNTVTATNPRSYKQQKNDKSETIH